MVRKYFGKLKIIYTMVTSGMTTMIEAEIFAQAYANTKHRNI